ncbi:MAG: glycosyltransferase family A protein [Cyanobacteriota bacterium]|nr:glycosyltransferase family A protein [Cyanobacteriota bacterium]
MKPNNRGQDVQPIGVVIIGRNEGERLIRSLESVIGRADEIVYVDSGSSDGSCEAARQMGVDVVELDLSIPFTAARARNAGFERLRQNSPQVKYVQFVDGDCEVVSGWIEAAAQTLETQPNVVAVCGWRTERYPESSVYNRICDIEWHSGVAGPTTQFGGDVMIRAEPLASVGGYDPTVIAAEDDELSVRLRQAGGEILRIDHNSTLHDADMHTLGQWWKRAKRCGYGFAQVSYLHGAPPERKFVREILRTWLWGLILPLVSLGLIYPTHGLSALLLGRYPLSAWRVSDRTHKQGYSWKDSIAWGLSCAASAFPTALGAIKFHLDRIQNKQHQIIEYKGPQAPVAK